MAGFGEGILTFLRCLGLVILFKGWEMLDGRKGVFKGDFWHVWR